LAGDHCDAHSDHYAASTDLERAAEPPKVLKPADQPVGTGANWPWRNLFRPSDPIGGAIFYAYAISAEDTGDVDWQLMDPDVGPLAGDRAWPRAYGHSDYFRDPAFAAACQLLEDWTVHTP